MVQFHATLGLLMISLPSLFLVSFTLFTLTVPLFCLHYKVIFCISPILAAKVNVLTAEVTLLV